MLYDVKRCDHVPDHCKQYYNFKSDICLSIFKISKYIAIVDELYQNKEQTIFGMHQLQQRAIELVVG